MVVVDDWLPELGLLVAHLVELVVFIVLALSLLLLNALHRQLLALQRELLEFQPRALYALPLLIPPIHSASVLLEEGKSLSP